MVIKLRKRQHSLAIDVILMDDSKIVFEWKNSLHLGFDDEMM